MELHTLPACVAWRHLGAREGHEVAFLRRDGDLLTFAGSTVAVEDGEPWVVDYHLTIDDRWRTRVADVVSRSRDQTRRVRLEHDGAGRWRRDGVSDDRLTGCLDVDLESSALTNTLPVHRYFLGEPTSAEVPAPAAYVRALDAAVERLEQSYRRLPDETTGPRFAYSAPVFGVSVTLRYDWSGLVLDYPGLAVRTRKS